jgi:hypothetical protein
MEKFDHDIRKAPFDALQSTVSRALSNDHVRRVAELGRGAINKVRNRNRVGCTYCGSAILADAPNCVNCGAGAPPPPPPSAKAEPNTWQRVATGVLWYFGGIIGLHCYAAGRPLRGLLYFTTSIAMFFMMTSYNPSGTLGGLTTFGPLSIGFGLFLLWAFDGVQILRGRFNR